MHQLIIRFVVLHLFVTEYMMVTYASLPCPVSCSCGKWKAGKETTDCTHGDFSKIPQGIPPTTQVLDLSGNKLKILYDYTFQNKSLVNLQRLFLSQCNIIEIRTNAFAQLSNLIELDLSYNSLQEIPAQAFSGTPALRQLNLRGNNINLIPGEAFTYTPSIVTLDISNSQILKVAPEAFQALSLLESLKLQENQIKELPRKMINGLAAIHNLEVHENPWICDCRILPLWRLLIRLRMSHPITPSCDVPSRLKGSPFDILTEKDLACPPEILPGTRFIEGVEGENTSIACRVWGEPAPRVQWYTDGKEITNSGRGRLVSLVNHKGDGDTVSNLLISTTKETDSGFIRCEAINPAGRVSVNFTLVVKLRPKIIDGLTSAHIAGIAAGVLIILIIVVASLLLCGKFRSDDRYPRIDKQRETAPSAVIVCASPNPVQKPPRLTELTSSNSADPDLISHLANGYPVSSSASSAMPGDYTRIEGDSLYPSDIWEEHKSKEQILHEHFNPGYESTDSPHHDPLHCSSTRNDGQIDPKLFGYPSDYGLPIPEFDQRDLYSSQLRVSSPTSNLTHLYDSRQELALYNSNSDIYNPRHESFNNKQKQNGGADPLSPMYEMVEICSPAKESMPYNQNLHDSGHQDSSSAIHDTQGTTENVTGDAERSPSGDRRWVPTAPSGRQGVSLGVPVLPPLPNGTLHRIKPRDSPDEGYQEGTEV